MWITNSVPEIPDVASALDGALGSWVRIVGEPQEDEHGVAVRVYGAQTNFLIRVVGLRSWSGAPSHRALAVVTGYLTKSDGVYQLAHPTHRWVDR